MEQDSYTQPDTQTQQFQAQPPVPPPVNKSSKGFLVFFLVLVLLGAAGVGAYFLGKNSTPTPTASVQTTATNTKENPANSSVHFIQDLGYPSDLQAKKIFTTSLGLPDFIQAVGVESSSQNPGINAYMTDKINDELGRWATGYPDAPNARGDVAIAAVSKSWLASTQQEYEPLVFSEDLRTPAKKQAYLTKIKQDTAACVKDSKKGFQFSDKSLSVCYELLTGKDGFAPTLQLRGYGEVNGLQLVLVGFIDITEGKQYSDKEDVQLRQDAAQGKLPGFITARQAKLVEALSKSTITVTDNKLN